MTRFRIAGRGRAVLVSAAIAASFALAPAIASAAEFVSVKGNTVNIRSQPNTSSQILWELNRGYPLEIEQKQGDWLKVRDFEGSLGWIYAPLTHNAAHRVVTGSTVNLRSGPGTNHGVVGKLERYEVVTQVGQQGDWLQVERSGGQKGWVSGRLTWGW